VPQNIAIAHKSVSERQTLSGVVSGPAAVAGCVVGSLSLVVVQTLIRILDINNHRIDKSSIRELCLVPLSSHSSSSAVTANGSQLGYVMTPLRGRHPEMARS
jgi:hypothetical protein